MDEEQIASPGSVDSQATIIYQHDTQSISSDDQQIEQVRL